MEIVGVPMKILFLGRGAALNLRENNTNILLDDSILLDCGITCPHAIVKHGFKPEQIEHIFISHLHSDHVGGLETFAWFHYINGTKLNVYSHVDVRSFLYHSMGEQVDEVINFPKTNPFGVYFVETQHVDNLRSFGYVINNILFTMDTNKVIVGDYDIIFHDCSHKRTATHACLEDLRAWPKEIKKKIWLMHLSDADYGDVSDFGGLVNEGYYTGSRVG